MQRQEMIQASAKAHRQETNYPFKVVHGAVSGTMIGGNGNGHYLSRSFAVRHRKPILVGSIMLTLAVIGTLVGVLIKRPWLHGDDNLSGGGRRNAQDHYGDGNGVIAGGGGNADGTPTRFTESSSISISSSVRCNAFTPPLDQPFQYGQQPIRGVNLGGWLVLEPYITPSIFSPFVAQNVTDEYTLTKLLGPEKAKTLLQKHYSSWVTEDTFKRVRDLGLNHVRIPIGFWALGNMEPEEPYVPDLSLDFLLQGLKWAAQYGLRVMVELHAAPGSQNGWNHSGRSGKIGWLDGTPEGKKNGKRTIVYMKQLLKLLQGPGMEHVSPLYGILNEPAIFMLEREDTDKWYKEAFAEMRNVTGQGTGPWGILHDGFLGLTQWEGFMPGSDRLALGKIATVPIMPLTIHCTSFFRAAKDLLNDD